LQSEYLLPGEFASAGKSEKNKPEIIEYSPLLHFLPGANTILTASLGRAGPVLPRLTAKLLITGPD